MAFLEDKSKFAGVEAKPAPDPFTLEALIAWLRGKDGEETYNYWNCSGRCLLSQYANEHGMDGAEYDAVYVRFRAAMGFDAQNIAYDEPHTFGAALARAEALL